VTSPLEDRVISAVFTFRSLAWNDPELDTPSASSSGAASSLELLKQPQYVPLAVERQILIIFAGTNGFVDDYPMGALRKYETDSIPSWTQSIRRS
jgi:F0F1-type ATP synthase alpha subunit